MKRSIHAIVLYVFIILASGCTEYPSSGKQVLITKGISGKVVDAYWLWLYLPRNYTPEKQWPEILFLQGGYRISPNPITSRDDGPVKFARLHADDFTEKSIVADSFIIINPHMSPGPSEKRQWYQYAENLLHIVDDVVEKYMGDNKSIYLTGLSRGGSGMGHCKAVS